MTDIPMMTCYSEMLHLDVYFLIYIFYIRGVELSFLFRVTHSAGRQGGRAETKLNLPFKT